MDITRFEAAVAYDMSVQDGARTYLILDLERGALGCCEHTASTQLLGEYGIPGGRNLWDDCVGAVSRMLGDGCRLDIRQDLVRQLPTANTALQDYLLSNKLMDRRCLCFSEREILCSQLEAALTSVKADITALLHRALEDAEQQGIDTDQARIILLGQAADLYSIQFCIRDVLSADPFLQDSRFANAGYPLSPARIVEAGMAAHRNSRTIGHTLELLLVDRDGQEQTVTLASADQSPQELTKTFGPVYFAPGDHFRLRVDGARRPTLVRPASDRIHGSTLLKVSLDDGTLYLTFLAGGCSDRAPILHSGA